jgi:hypothetical protein
MLDQAMAAAVCGEDARARLGVRAALATSRGGFSPMIAANALALAGFAEEARPLLDEVAKRFPVNTLIQAIGLPTARAALQLRAGNPAKAIELLEEPKRYELGVAFVYLPVYVRGLAGLRAGAGGDAKGAFQKVVDNPGVDPLSVMRPLAQLGLARSMALAGDVAGSRRAYQDFLALWKDADTDIPILREARAEYAKLQDR